MSKFKMVGRIAALGLAVVMLAGCSGGRFADRNEVRTRALEFVALSGAVIPDSVLYPNGIQHRSLGAWGVARTLQSQRERLIDIQEAVYKTSNNYFELWFGPMAEVYFLCLRTYEIHSTNPVFYDFGADERTERFGSGVGVHSQAERIMKSQLDLTYFNHRDGRTNSLFSFGDSVSAERSDFFTEVGTRDRIDENGNVRTNPTFTVTYTIGQDMEDFSLMLGMSQERFYRYVERLQALVDAGEIDIPTMRVFVNNHTLLSYQMMRDGLTQFDADEYRLRYPALPELGYVYMLKPVAPRLYNQILVLYGMIGITDQDFYDNYREMGNMEMAQPPSFFRIPLVYELDGNSIVVSIDFERIEQAPSPDFTLERINILRTFGATMPVDEGYIFIPDGSGAIIRNNEPLRGMSTHSLPFFGPDFGRAIPFSDMIPSNSTFPVFGARRNNVGMFAIVEQGASLGGVVVELAGRPELNAVGNPIGQFSGQIAYNRVFPFVTFHAWDTVMIIGTNLSRMFTREAYNTEFTIRYNFLYDDWATYVGWAQFYQKYLERTGAITRMESAMPLPLDINLIGSISKPVNTLGIPRIIEYGVTTFNQAETIMGTLHDSGIRNANLVYSGIINGGMNFRAPNRVRFQSELGGSRGFNRLYSNLNEQGVSLFTTVDFGRAYQRGNGISLGLARNDTSRHVSGHTAHIMDYAPAFQHRSFGRGNNSAILNPLLYSFMAANFIRGYQNSTDHRSVYLASIGDLLNSNFNEDMELTREDVMVLTRDLLTEVQDAGFEIMLDSGNSYVLEFADRLINVPTSSSGRRLESYSIPFVAMVLSGYLPFTGESINRSGNMHRSILEAAESGAGLHYTLIYANQLVLVDTWYRDMFSVNYRIWLNDIIDAYTRMNDKMGHLTNERIVNHERLGVRGTPEHQIVRVTYENGCVVYVNYGRVDFVTESGHTVYQLDYLVIDSRR